MSIQLSEREKVRVKILDLHDKRFSNKAIARQLNVAPTTVATTLRRNIETGSIKDRPRPGRPRKIEGEAVKRLVKRVKGRERQSTRKTAASFKATKGQRVGRETVRKTIKAQGLIPHRRKRRPKLTEAQKAKRVVFAKKYLRHDWSDTAFWDEKQFELTHPPNPKDDVVWDERGAEIFKEEVAHPISYNVGLAITVQGATRLAPYTGTINSQKFIDMVDGPIEDLDELFDGEDYVWLMDNASCHRSKLTQGEMVQKVPNLFPKSEWPANSPDISAIENVFGYVQDLVDQKHPNDLKSLQRIVKAEFKKLTPEKCQKFISELPSRLKRIIASNGEYCY
jgi:transposase